MKRVLLVALTLMFLFLIARPVLATESDTDNLAVIAVILNVNRLKWPIGTVGRFSVVVFPSRAKNKSVSWKSANTKVATVDSTGKIKAVGIGRTKITCTSKENAAQKATCSIEIGKAVTSIKLNVSNFKWPIATSGKLKAVVVPKNAICKDLVWTSSNPSVASVSVNGNIVANSSGNATITCSAKYNSKVREICRVFVTEPYDGGLKVFYEPEIFICGNAMIESNQLLYSVTKDPLNYQPKQDGYYDDWRSAIMYQCDFNEVRVKFDYGDMNWMILLRKGQYGGSFIGSETYVFTKPKTKIVDEYERADNAHQLLMNMTLYQNGTNKFSTSYRCYYWNNGFTNGWLTQPAERTELTSVARITLFDAAMTKAFTNALESKGFQYAAKAGRATPDTYTVRGNDVYINWKNIGQPKINSKVIFLCDGGSAIPAMIGVAGENLNYFLNPTKDGCKFLGWVPALPETFPLGVLNVHAKWTPQ